MYCFFDADGFNRSSGTGVPYVFWPDFFKKPLIPMAPIFCDSKFFLGSIRELYGLRWEALVYINGEKTFVHLRLLYQKLLL